MGCDECGGHMVNCINCGNTFWVPKSNEKLEIAKQNKNVYPRVTVDGKQIARGRMKFFERAIDIWKSQNPDADLSLYKILITVVPKTPVTDDGNNSSSLNTEPQDVSRQSPESA